MESDNAKQTEYNEQIDKFLDEFISIIYKGNDHIVARKYYRELFHQLIPKYFYKERLVMKKRIGKAEWNGSFKDGKGKVKFGSFEGNYSFKSRFEEGEGTNPEEMIAAAHAGCFSMALSKDLSENGYPPKKIETTAEVSIEILSAGPKITLIQLKTEAVVPNLDKEKFQRFVKNAKVNCPVSQALKSVEIELTAKLN